MQDYDPAFDNPLDLADELWTHIMGRLDARSLVAVGATCAHLERLADDNRLWLARMNADFCDDRDTLPTCGDLAFRTKDVYACRWLRRLDASGTAAPRTQNVCLRGRMALTKISDGGAAAIACGRFGDDGLLEGYGEYRVEIAAKDGNEANHFAYRGAFRDGAYHGWGTLEIHGIPHERLHKWVTYGKTIKLRCSGLRTLLGTDHWAAWHMTRFTGIWSDGLQHGDGVATYSRVNGMCATYKGQWRYGQWHGRGWFSSDDGGHCGPDFVAGRPHGDVVLRCTGSPDYLYEGRLHGRMAYSGCFAFADGTRLVVGSRIVGDRVKATLHTAAGEVYDGEWDESNNGEAVERGTGHRVSFHDLVRWCTVTRVDRAGRTWRGCTQKCFGIGEHRGSHQDARPHGFQKVTYPNGDVLCGRWRHGLVWVTSFTVSRTCLDNRFAGVIFQGFVWAYRADHAHENDEWIFWPRQRSHPQRDLFAAYVQSGLGPWSPKGLAIYGTVL
jgi:hypothetical protein